MPIYAVFMPPGSKDRPVNRTTRSRSVDDGRDARDAGGRTHEGFRNPNRITPPSDTRESAHRARPFARPARAAPAGDQQALVEADPEHCFVPPYVGHRGWLGVYLDVPVDWDQIAELVVDAYRVVAPKRLAAQLDEGR
jgi:hypothetical protein